MRFVTYASPQGGERVGVVDDDVIYGAEPGVTLLDLLDRGHLDQAGERALTSPTETVPVSATTLLPPLRPRSVRDCSAFHQHLRNCSGDPDRSLDERHRQFPVFYFSNPAAVIGPTTPVPVAPGSRQFDFELEVCAVIGRNGRNISPRNAEDHIVGYAILCDWSARDLQLYERPLGLGPAKGKDTATTIGPALVTKQELEPFRAGKGFNLEMTASVNGVQVTAGSWAGIDWSYADIVAYASRGTTLQVGDVIGSGTVGSGCLYEHFALGTDRFRGWLQPGDNVHITVEKLGELRQRIVSADPVHPLSSGY
jgi:2-keto-4-pentenoate hydratase/2-oxohepta-3-ene-1,7-dioic acid hydratase in catechol pathway